ncbi:hypothetical protein M406DRAFT_330421 [Cryphonectria parasitica EP155]|uniref:Nephrocystin 3-like N-terminal domain-containing protein n=1 Tax=Cryphonectria parasitica (strain ATCC 38755 / EP155) TaxID=660469 RepID=A0A9P4Y0C2_CRYP1|nr:uncharacterized protein M406DRAFT_330421 [Cryphonectria parasitica EP155]KAF3764065.1 hypothetical protein M406DRAFT_330421 [Cryphonectria parasitica EP155]
MVATLPKTGFQYVNSHKKGSKKVFYFLFDSHDLRFNSLRATLRTCISQLAYQGLGRRSDQISRIASYMLALQAWTDEHLLMYWRHFQHHTDDIYITASLDECDGWKRKLLSFLRILFALRESRSKTIITTTADSDEQLSLELATIQPSDVYKEERLNSDFLVSATDNEDIRFQLSKLLHENSRLASNQAVAEVVRDVLNAYGQDDDQRHIKEQWLSTSRHFPAHWFEEHLSRLSTTGEGDCVFPLVLRAIPKEWREWARPLLSCVPVICTRYTGG